MTPGVRRIVDQSFGGDDLDGRQAAGPCEVTLDVGGQTLTAIITAERTDTALTRQGLEEYVSDCVIVLDHRVHEQVSTRRIRVVKYRGTAHGTNEYPFLIGDEGVTVLPVTSVTLEHPTPPGRISMP